MRIARCLMILLLLLAACGGGSSAGTPGKDSLRPLNGKELIIWQFILDGMQELDIIRLDSDDQIPLPMIKEAPGEFNCEGTMTCACNRGDYIEICKADIDNIDNEEFVYGNEFVHRIINIANNKHLLTLFVDRNTLIYKANNLF